MRNSYFIFFMVCSLSAIGIGYWIWQNNFQKIEEISIEKPASVYEKVELDLPVMAFLMRCMKSSQISIVRRLGFHGWLALNQGDLLKLIVYGYDATNFKELKKLWERGMAIEGEKNAGCAVIRKTLKIVASDSALIKYVTQALQSGMPEDMHVLQGRLFGLDKKSKQYKKIQSEYRRALEDWIDKQHGQFIDQMIAMVI